MKLTTFSLSKQAREDLDYWKKHNQKIVQKINTLVKSTMVTPYEGIGKPEPLKHSLSGYWSRRITPKDRMIYTIEASRLIIIQLRHHY